MEEITTHPPVLCPQCHKPTLHTTLGDVCANCNLVLRHAPNATQPASSAPLPNLAINPLPSPAPAPAPAPAPEVSIDQPPTATLQQASRFRHRLKARMRRLVVPELPSNLSQQAIDSPLSEVALPKLINPHTEPARHTAPPSATQIPTPWRNNDAEDRSSQAFRLAEVIAETDNEPNINMDQTKSSVPATITPTEEPAPKSGTQYHQKLLLGGTMLGIVMVFMIGIWAAQRNAPVNTPQPTAPNSSPNSTESSKATPEATKRDTQRKADLTSLATALEVYKRDIGTYPAGNDISVVYGLQYTTPPYISYIGYDPSSDAGTKIKYSYTSDGSSFTLAARLEDATDPDNQNGYYVVKSQ